MRCDDVCSSWVAAEGATAEPSQLWMRLLQKECWWQVAGLQVSSVAIVSGRDCFSCRPCQPTSEAGSRGAMDSECGCCARQGTPLLNTGCAEEAVTLAALQPLQLSLLFVCGCLCGVVRFTVITAATTPALALS